MCVCVRVSDRVGPHLRLAQVTWQLDLGAPSSSSPVVGDDGSVYVGASDGNFFRISSTGTVLWSQPVGAGDKVQGTACLSLSQGLVFVGTSNTNGTTLAALELATGAFAWAASPQG